jgi:hypothetical protein
VNPVGGTICALDTREANKNRIKNSFFMIFLLIHKPFHPG